MAYARSPLADFFNTPGASTDDPVWKAKLGGPPEPKFETWLKGTWDEYKIMELDDATELEAALADLAADLTTKFTADQAADLINGCYLEGPGVLTVYRGGRFSKVSHIGGEEFTPVEAYLGKRGKILIKFKPVSGTEYEHMEMGADEALAQLSGFNILSVTEQGSYEDRVRALKSQASALREREKVKDKFEEYKDLGFGTF